MKSATPHPVRHPIFARAFPAMSRALEAGGIAEHRKYYPATVSRVLAVEPEPRLRAAAIAAAREIPVPIEVTNGVASALPAEDASYDAAVVSLVLCSVPDQDAALAEIRRVLRPGAVLCFLAHVRAESASLVRMQRAPEDQAG